MESIAVEFRMLLTPMTKFIALALLASWTCASAAERIEERESLRAMFEAENARGTFVLRDGKTGALLASEVARAHRQYVPASTFKIPNTLIGLETSAVKSVDEILPYGGKPQPIPQWEHDMPLREAIRISTVPIYQELARRVGKERMRDWVKSLEYGNTMTGEVVDRFWLDGPLEISAIEQAEFLARLADGKVPASAANLAAVKDITRIEKRGALSLHAKTGWCTSCEPKLGWWVGWLESEGKLVASFALNMDMPEMSDAPKRERIGRAILDALGILPRRAEVAPQDPAK